MHSQNKENRSKNSRELNRLGLFTLLSRCVNSETNDNLFVGRCWRSNSGVKQWSRHWGNLFWLSNLMINHLVFTLKLLYLNIIVVTSCTHSKQFSHNNHTTVWLIKTFDWILFNGYVIIFPYLFLHCRSERCSGNASGCMQRKISILITIISFWLKHWRVNTNYFITNSNMLIFQVTNNLLKLCGHLYTLIALLCPIRASRHTMMRTHCCFITQSWLEFCY